MSVTKRLLAAIVTLIGMGPVSSAVPASGLVAVEIEGPEASLDEIASRASILGWKAIAASKGMLRLSPPEQYDPSKFEALLTLIEQLYLGDIGLRLIGPNGPDVGN